MAQGVEQVGLSVTLDAAGAIRGSAKLAESFGKLGRATERLRDARGRFVSYKKADAALLATARASSTATRSMVEARSASLGLGTALAGIGLGVIATETVRAAASYEQLRTALITSEGSAAKAADRFEALKRLAAETPFRVDDLVKAWVRASAQGLDASQDFLRAAGDVVAGAGDTTKTVTDLVNAIADAEVGQYTRLLESFGIKAKKAGAQIELRLGDVVTRGKTAQEALEKLSAAKFGGAMERQSQTLAGAWSTLQDNVTALADEIGQGGLVPALREVVLLLSETSEGGSSVAREFGETLASGVRLFGDALRFVIDHGDALRAVLEGLVAARIVQGIGALHTALTAMAASSPLGWVAAAAGAIVTLHGALDGLPRVLAVATTAVIGLNVAMTALAVSNPLGWVVSGIGLLVTLFAYLGDIKDAVSGLMDDFKTAYGFLPAVEEMADKSLKRAKAMADGRPLGAAEWFTWEGLSKPLTAAKDVAGDAMKAAKKFKPKKKGLSGAGNDRDAKKLAEDLRALTLEANAAEDALGQAFGGATATELEAVAALQKFTQEHPAATQAQRDLAAAMMERRRVAEAALEVHRELEALTRSATLAEDALGQAFGGATDAELASVAALEEFAAAHPAATEAERELAAAMLRRKQVADDALASYRAHQEALKQVGGAIAEEAERLRLMRGGARGDALDGQMEAWRAIYDLQASGVVLSEKEALQLRQRYAALAALRSEQEALTAAEEKSAAQQEALLQALSPATEALTRQFGFLQDSVAILTEGASQFVDTLVDGILEGQAEWGELGPQILKDLTKAALKAAIIFAVKTGARVALAGVSGGASEGALGFGQVLASVLHSGGMAGGGSLRAVPASVFSGAPRFHKGGEVPAILRAGERVTTPEQESKKHQQSAPQRTSYVTVNISTPDVDSFRRDRSNTVRQFARELDRSQRRGG